MSVTTDTTPKTKGGWWALSPLAVFLCLYPVSYTHLKYVISTLRESFSATHNGWKAMIYNGEEFYESKRYDINPIVDRVGGGDSFSGGIIHGLLTKPNQGCLLYTSDNFLYFKNCCIFVPVHEDYEERILF